jgi:hypothetical protein
MHPHPRKTNPRVIGGKVQKKNHWGATDDYYVEPQLSLRFERKKPGLGYRHVVSIGDLKEFIAILPDWDELSKGLDAVILARGSPYSFGTYSYGYTEHGFIRLRAWSEGLEREWGDSFFQENRPLIDRLHVRYERDGPNWIMRFDENTARGFMLLDVFLHELGHHHERMRTRSKRGDGITEPYAEAYAREYGERIWNDYARRFRI